MDPVGDQSLAHEAPHDDPNQASCRLRNAPNLKTTSVRNHRVWNDADVTHASCVRQVVT